MSTRTLFAIVLFSLFALICVSAAAPDYVAVDAIFSKYCLDCHESKDPEAKLVLENYPKV